ncbi:helix-turn-helix domain-containing protein [Desulfovibrio sp.]|uniref:helix-turn-helix domain-containing protein n=1 Tax=Desulfovibrio sp. TaxID=885 RepID=UPI0023BEF657|nr:helix-turn-helix domain-containing protein [Desulfovibrio sp.]MDE7240284.1 helix-turn-helix domain-containing protein [Desulfovibrio sp.]
MSIDAMNWAWRQRNLTVGQKLVLLALADRASETHTCWPSMTRLCQDTGLSDRGIQKIFIELEGRKLIRREHRSGQVTVFTLLGVDGREATPELSSPPNSVRPEPGSPRTQFPPNSVRDTPEPSSGLPPNYGASPLKVEPKEEPKENPKRVRARARSPQAVKEAFGEYGNVRLTAEEHQRLMADFGEKDTAAAIEFLDLHLGARRGADPYKSHYLAMRKWVFNAVAEQARRAGTPRASPGQPVKSWQEREFEAAQAAFLAGGK